MVMENPLVDELFPIGMHVLAVDDNRVCLNMLESMLLKCNYKVTTTAESGKALEILRENRDMFDLVICDVNMPEMDGFKLLKQVELEMDLPFVMLSGNGDTESVMKGVMNGASDYILKPIRMEEVKTIWQHVVRKKIDGKVQIKKKVSGANNVAKKVSEEEKIDNVARVCSRDTASDDNVADKSPNVGEKRKERSDSEEDNDTDGSTEKKPRFVWDTELHNKFVVAVNQLGLDKAYPKKILELMNIEGLTRENVASHLQKFRLNLKRSDKHPISTSPYLQSGSVGGGRFINGTLPSYASPSYGSSHLVCRLNTPSGLNVRRMSYAPGPSFQSHNNINCFQMPVASASERPCFLPNFRTSIGTNQFQQNNYLTGYPSSSSFQGCKVAVNNANSSSFISCIPRNHPLTYNANSSSVSCIPSNHPLINANRSSLSCITGNQPVTHNSEAFRNHSSVGIADVKTQSLNNTLDSVGGAELKTESQSTNNPLDTLTSLAKSDSQLITQMPETEKFYAETLDSNDDCFFNQMLYLKEGFYDNSRLSLDDIY
ncbi:unnamed protein product [Lathyrus sativus]|nr:unnamed protein product [Lathyrus sativus]